MDYLKQGGYHHGHRKHGRARTVSAEAGAGDMHLMEP